MQILVPTAGSEPDPINAAYVVGIAQALDAGLLILHVCQADDPQEGWMQAAAAFEEAAADTEVSVDALQTMADHTHDRGEAIARSIANVAAEGHCALIVMGASPQAKLSGWVSGRVREASSVPVVVVPQPEVRGA